MGIAIIQDAFEIMHNYRETYFCRKRNSFYEKRRKEKKLMLKKISKIRDLWR